jgi:hypothetical protein
LVIGTTVRAKPLCVVEGWAALSALPAIAALPAIKTIDLPKYSRAHPPIAARARELNERKIVPLGLNGSPAIDGNGIGIMNVTAYIAQTGVTGAGVNIGVISDDATSLALIQGRGELPASISLIAPSANASPHTALTDEGTMMLEEVYAVAPDANLSFCGPATAVEYIACLQNLIDAGATVVSDDLTYTEFDVMSAPAQNLDGQAVANILTASPNVMLYHSVGNDAEDYWQGAYNPLRLGGTCYPSGSQSQQNDSYFAQFGNSEGLTWQTAGGNSLILASVLPTGQSTPNQFDLYIVGPAPSQTVVCATAAGGGTVGATSYTLIDGSDIAPGTYTIYIGSPDASLSGSLLKLIGSGDGADSFGAITAGSPASPQDFAPGVITMGAVIGSDGVGNMIEPFSDTGPIQVESPIPSTLQAPFLVAPDAIYVDNIGTKFIASGGIFFGTSAASPNGAAVAALLRSAFPTLPPAQITSYLENGAAALGGQSPSGTFGYGRVDAMGALGMIPPPTIAGLQGTTFVGGTSSPALPFTIGGTGMLRVSATSSTNVIPSGSSGISISPSNCGNPTTACSLVLTPAAGMFGSASIQVTVSDGANRSQSLQVPIVVLEPAAPTIAVTTGAAQSVVVNAPISPVTFTLMGTGPLTINASYSGSVVTLTSGCGTTTMTCTATIGSASNTPGVGTLTISAQDGYGQTATSSTTVTVTKPAPPTITITAGASQSLPVNQPIAPVVFTVMGTGALTVSPNSNEISDVTITAGCGTTTMTCTATLGTAQSTPVTATLTLRVNDSYGQSASASATVTETAVAAPPAAAKGGGGSLDLWTVMSLVGLVGLRLAQSTRERRP